MVEDGGGCCGAHLHQPSPISTAFHRPPARSPPTSPSRTGTAPTRPAGREAPSPATGARTGRRCATGPASSAPTAPRAPAGPGGASWRAARGLLRCRVRSRRPRGRQARSPGSRGNDRGVRRRRGRRGRARRPRARASARCVRAGYRLRRRWRGMWGTPGGRSHSGRRRRVPRTRRGQTYIGVTRSLRPPPRMLRRGRRCVAGPRRAGRRLRGRRRSGPPRSGSTRGRVPG